MSQSLRRSLIGCVGGLLWLADAGLAVGQPAVFWQRLQARADALELDTPYQAPPGDVLSHHTAGFAKILCSAVFISGLDPQFAAENLGYFTSPYAERARVVRRVIDHADQAVHLTLADGTTRSARIFGDQGAVALPSGQDRVYFEPTRSAPGSAARQTLPWPLGDRRAAAPLPPALDADLVARAVEAAFADPAEMTAALVVTWRGQIIAERYAEGIAADTPLESWSMGKSLAATLMGVLLQQGVYDLWQPAPVPEWQAAGDPRAQIRIADLLRMSSGLRFRAPQDPDFTPAHGYSDHRYIYTGGVDAHHWAATRPLQWPPNTVGRYRNSDPLLIGYLLRLAVEGRGEDYLTFPRRALLDGLGMRDTVLETDPYGNFLLPGYVLGAARDWARLGNLYLQDGVWQGERLLPEGFVDFVRTPAPAWVADGRPVYGGSFWLNTRARYPVPRDAYYMAGSGGQMTLIVPSHDLVVVRMGHHKGAAAGERGLLEALRSLLRALPDSAPAAP